MAVNEGGKGGVIVNLSSIAGEVSCDVINLKAAWDRNIPGNLGQYHGYEGR